MIVSKITPSQDLGLYQDNSKVPQNDSGPTMTKAIPDFDEFTMLVQTIISPVLRSHHFGPPVVLATPPELAIK